ncbi:helix-turn-helix domain-containing protein [Nocardia higoensis]|uniref:helix-turn-helix domain-containing protein n=1 Tax=Nocardia higoensis TaxID=228599 RepID=UPI0012F69AAB|nr:helix-turn-helix domain-containing protein [Nocardia higoensis]
MVEIEWTPLAIRALREALRRSPLEFARMVGITNRTLSLWESGKTSKPHASSKRLLHEVLENAPADAQQRFWSVVGQPIPTNVPPRSTDGGGESDYLLSAADESAALLAWAEASNVGPLTLEDLRDNLRWVTHQYLKSPTLPLFRRVVETRNRAIELLQGRQRPHQSTALYAIAGWSMTLLGWITIDLGRPDIASRHLRTAWALAENTQDNELRGWVRAAQNTAAACQGDYNAANAAATAGLAYAGTGSAGLLLASARAIDLAHIGRVSESTSALRAAREIADQFIDEPPSDQYAGPLSCSIERAGGYWADAALVNGQAQQCVEFATEALVRFRVNPPELRNLGSERMVQTQQIKGYITLGDFDMAIAALRDVVETTPAEHRMGPLIQRVDEIAQLANDSGTHAAEATEMREIATEFAEVADLAALAAETNGGSGL